MKIAYDMDTLEFDEVIEVMQIAKKFSFELKQVEGMGLCVFISKFVEEVKE